MKTEQGKIKPEKRKWGKFTAELEDPAELADSAELADFPELDDPAELEDSADIHTERYEVFREFGRKKELVACIHVSTSDTRKEKKTVSAYLLDASFAEALTEEGQQSNYYYVQTRGNLSQEEKENIANDVRLKTQVLYAAYYRAKRYTNVVFAKPGDADEKQLALAWVADVYESSQSKGGRS